MRGVKYFFNHKTLRFEPKKATHWQRIFMISGVLVFIVLASYGVSSLFVSNFDTPGMRSLREENNKLLAQYNFLNSKLNQIESVLDEIQVRDDNIYRVIFDKNPIPESVRKAGFGGIDKYSDLKYIDESELVLNTSRRVDIVAKQAYIQAKSYEEVLKLAINKEEELSSTPAIMPVSNNDLSFMSSGWGVRLHPVYKVRMFHWGIDFVAPRGTKIYSTGNGTIESVINQGSGHGKHIIINHGFGFKTLYAHLSKFNVTEGQKIKRGQVIGYVGCSGTSTAPHLHYEVFKNGDNVDPKYYFFKDLNADEFDQLVARSENNGRSFD